MEGLGIYDDRLGNNVLTTIRCHYNGVATVVVFEEKLLTSYAVARSRLPYRTC